MFYLA